jgi:AraC-like DNA-binding protein
LDAPAVQVQEKQRIVPDGCMEMIFNLGDLFHQFQRDGTFITQPRSFVFGQITSALEIAPSGKTGIIAARFHPEGFNIFSPVEIRSMDNRAVSLEELYGERGILLEQQVLSAATTESRIEIIETFLMTLLSSSHAIDALAKTSVEILLNSSGQVSIDILAQEVQTSRRQLERKFSSAIGLSPKQLSKIIRLQATLKMMNEKQFSSLTALAHENGYFDQAHFVKDFKEFTGLSPKQFYANDMKLSALFISAE